MHGGIGMRFSNRISPIVQEIVNKTDRFIVILYRVYRRNTGILRRLRRKNYLSGVALNRTETNLKLWRWIVFDFSLFCNEISLLFFCFFFVDYNCDRIKCARLDMWLDIIAYIFDESFRSKLYWRTCDIGEKILDIDGYSRKFVLQHLCNRKLNQDLDNLISNFSNLTELLEEESLSRRNYWKK